MEPNEPSDFETTWVVLPLEARVAFLTLVAEQAARDHGITDEVQPIDHGWMVVEQVGGAEQLITADAFAAITNNADERTPPGFTEAVHALLDTPSSDARARDFIARCNSADVDAALATVATAVSRGSDLTPPIALQHEFARRRSQ